MRVIDGFLQPSFSGLFFLLELLSVRFGLIWCQLEKVLSGLTSGVHKVVPDNLRASWFDHSQELIAIGVGGTFPNLPVCSSFIEVVWETKEATPGVTSKAQKQLLRKRQKKNCTQTF